MLLRCPDCWVRHRIGQSVLQVASTGAEGNCEAATFLVTSRHTSIEGVGVEELQLSTGVIRSAGDVISSLRSRVLESGTNVVSYAGEEV